ncbi:MAG: hypothetical protein Q8O79_05185 [Pseudomonadota bacterium]|nr:hypothetical protein [Pseudomonadota bacterium]
MLESLAFALVKTFITFMFEQHLDHMQSVRIEGAPGWYYQQTKQHICDSGAAHGGLGAVEQSKANARNQMVIRLNKALEIVVYENFRNKIDPTERALVERFKQDENLPVFVESAVIYENIEYKEKQETAFARVCIPRERLHAYQEERVGKLKKAVTLHHRDRAFDALESEMGVLPK